MLQKSFFFFLIDLAGYYLPGMEFVDKNKLLHQLTKRS